MERISLRLTEEQVDKLDEAVDAGRWPSRSEAIRDLLNDEFGDEIFPIASDFTLGRAAANE